MTPEDRAEQWERRAQAFEHFCDLPMAIVCWAKAVKFWSLAADVSPDAVAEDDAMNRAEQDAHTIGRLSDELAAELFHESIADNTLSHESDGDSDVGGAQEEDN